MSRSDSVDSLMLTHFDWDEDSLIIEEQGHKADQKGDFKSLEIYVCKSSES